MKKVDLGRVRELVRKKVGCKKSQVTVPTVIIFSLLYVYVHAYQRTLPPVRTFMSSW